MRKARTSERQGRVIDNDESSSMEKKKREGYFDGSLANCHDRCPASLYWLIVVDKACAEANKEKIHGRIAGHDNYYCIEIDVTKLSNVRLACFDWVWDHCQSFILENNRKPRRICHHVYN